MGPGLEWWFEFDLDAGFSNLPIRMRGTAIPLWSIALIPATLAGLAWRRHTRPDGRCPCGYDRAGLPRGSPCPECGSKQEGVAEATEEVLSASALDH